MPPAHTLTIAGRAIAIKELTVADIRAWLRSLETQQLPVADGTEKNAPGIDLIAATLIPDVDLFDLVRMTDLTPEAIDALTPSQIRQVLAACQEVNSDFFGLQARLAAIGQAALATSAAS